ncbi:DUF6456 domain-containing protein [Devosia sp. SL43]|uniref:DUF6456 domain-containing protein n=1 Tax=Devosia sp. SL43 TaxID=2806348 RepID=UPI001F4578A6|nr:DUF6456 domain-containing protein [Devosia sp. SL43]UJW87903.1 hypothetical protein IM737_20695 [Devosia sp. SL43]
MTDELSNEAKSAAARLFIRGQKSRRNSIDDQEALTSYSVGVDELIKAKLVTRRRRPRCPGVMLFRGTPATADIGKAWAASSVPAPATPDNSVAADVRVVQHDLVQDPYMTDAEYFHQRSIKSGPAVGKVSVSRNMVEYVGGLARLGGASEMHLMAAAKYRTAYERAQIGGARAVDYAAVKVDTSGPREDVLAGRTVDALEAYKDAVRCLGMMRSSVVERVICHDQSLTTRGMGSRARDRAKRELFAALDDLAVHFKLAMKRAA